jgi:hypothetical protein
MFAIPGIIALVIFIYVRPQEFFEPLRALPLLYLFFGLALYGALVDVRVGNLRLRSTPQFPWVLAFLVYASCTVVIRRPSDAFGHIMGLTICVALYALVAHGVQTFRALHVVAGTVLGMVLVVCGVGAHQGFAPTGCVVVDETIRGDQASGKPDGRPCDSVRSCYLGDAEPGAQYLCERIGLFGTTSVGRGRVRYRGVLQDPNELALAGGVGLPLAFALGRVPKRTLGRGALVLLTLALVMLCAVLTRSRSGQLVFMAVVGVYFLRRFGWKGVLLAGTAALPLLVLGGRSGAEADKSTSERMDCWMEALLLWKSHPFTGVGLGQFGEYHYLTAHNSYLLTLAELGPIGMLLFSIIIYVSLKIPFGVLRHIPANGALDTSGAAAVARPWATALLAAFAGLAVGIFFLSFAYHYVLWIYVGLAGALYSAVRTHDPTFRVRFGLPDLVLVAAANAGIIATVYFYTRLALR